MTKTASEEAASFKAGGVSQSKLPQEIVGVRLLCLMSIFAFAIFALIDPFMVDTSLTPLRWTRLAAVIGGAICMGMTYLDRIRRHHRLAGAFICIWTGVCVVILTGQTGGPSSPYWTMVMLTFFTVALVIPFKPWQGAITFGAVALFYNVWMWLHMPQADIRDTVTSNAGIWLSLFISVVALRFISDVRLNEEASRVRRMEAQIAQDRAKALSKAGDVFMASMSHEVRTPLNGIVSVLELMGRTNLDATQRRYISIMARSSKTLLTVINDILDFAKADATVAATVFCPTTMLEEVAMPFELMAAESGLAFHMEMSNALPDLVIGDPSRIGQILNNILSNAIKYTAQGEIGFTILSQAKAPDQVEFYLTVKDTGAGIDDSKLETIFGEFVQGSILSPKASEGLGLGLAISRRLAHSMGGDVTAQSTIGKGSTFTFRVTLNKAVGMEGTTKPTQEVASGAPEQPTSPTAIKVLVAEDNEVNQLVIKAMLEALGCTVDVVENGSLAVSRALQKAYDLIMLDCAMPVQDGISAASELCARLKSPQRPPLVAVTASVMQQDRRDCANAGMDDFLAKPVDFSDLSRILNKWVPAYKMVSPESDRTESLNDRPEPVDAARG